MRSFFLGVFNLKVKKKFMMTGEKFSEKKLERSEQKDGAPKKITPPPQTPKRHTTPPKKQPHQNFFFDRVTVGEMQLMAVR
jgi:hypothetical protein